MKIAIKKDYWIYIVYGILVGIVNIIIFSFVWNIQSNYGSDLIALRFNVYEGITLIDSARYVWQYGIYSVIISICNGLIMWYLETVMKHHPAKNMIIQWIFGTTMLAISVFGYYLWLVIRINS
jgi:hypothetical protein